MKYAEYFEDMAYLEVDEGILKGKNPIPCCVCGELTIFIDLCSEAPFCSEECLEKFYNDYWDSEREKFGDDYDYPSW